MSHLFPSKDLPGSLQLLLRICCQTKTLQACIFERYMLPDSVVLCVGMERNQIRGNIFIILFSVFCCVFHSFLISFSLSLEIHTKDVQPSVLFKPTDDVFAGSLIWDEVHPENNLIPGILCALNSA